ncbi:Calx-beta domain-containing protein [Paenibacillus sp. 481]|uniref:Calx-beta domain-containing protein n=1 Tax=Paenibacillus sp. 481 TaxID=2835869 RepID=UPI001E5C1DB7|nr:Calx-beta domain-containing protein [Paenibacillus sp. 481]UHA75644.1 hypothetical protein KIK04_12010 [Paenibacillus sp. 481]
MRTKRSHLTSWLSKVMLVVMLLLSFSGTGFANEEAVATTEAELEINDEETGKKLVVAYAVCSDKPNFHKWVIDNKSTKARGVNWKTSGQEKYKDDGYVLINGKSSATIYSVKDPKSSKNVKLTVKDEKNKTTLATAASEQAECGDPGGGKKRGKIQFTLSDYGLWEDEGGVILTIERIKGDEGEITAQVCLCSGTADAGKDFDDQVKTVVFGDGEVVKEVFIPIVNDNQVEDDENFKAWLQADDDVLGFRQATWIHIKDDDY